MSHTFRIGHFDSHSLSSCDIAQLLFNNFGISNGFVCPCMAYMSQYRESYVFDSAETLQKAIDKYCNAHNITSFDYSRFYIIFNLNGKLMKTEIQINKSGKQDQRLVDIVTRQLRTGTPDEAKAYKSLFKTGEEIQSVEPAKTYLPPYYNSAGQHIGGGFPGQDYSR